MTITESIITLKQLPAFLIRQWWFWLWIVLLAWFRYATYRNPQGITNDQNIWVHFLYGLIIGALVESFRLRRKEPK